MLKAELARKEELLNDTKLKIANFEHSLKDLDQQIQIHHFRQSI